MSLRGKGLITNYFSGLFPHLRSSLDKSRLELHRTLGAKRVVLEASENELGKLDDQIDVHEKEAFEPHRIEVRDFPDSKKIHSHLYLARKDLVIHKGWFDFRTGVAGIGKYALSQSKTNIARAGLVMPLPIPETRVVTGLAICAGMVRWNYYHWLVEELPALLRATKLAPEAQVFIGHDAPRFVLDSLNFLQIPFGLKKGSWRFDALVLATRNSDIGWPHPADIKVLLEAFGRPSGPAKAGAVFASRVLASRKLTNEEEVSKWVQQFAFTPLLFEQLPFAEQVRIMNECDAVAGTHGAGLANMLFMPEESRVVEIVQTFKPCFEILARVLGHDYDRVYADKSWSGRYRGNIRAIEAALISAK